jgi:predicted RNA methylase
MEQKSGLKRNTIDKYYTKSVIVYSCINNIKLHLDIKKTDIIIEPSAGNGAFISSIKELTNNYKFYDIKPDNKEIEEKDFLKIIVKKPKNKKIHIIGNPPFGRQSSTAIKFIKKCCEFSDSISFILPKSFKKTSLQKYFDKYYHLIFQEDLPENSFLINEKECNVPCVFQIWKLSKTPRKDITKQTPKGFEFVKKNQKPDISFRRVGVYAGKISEIIDDKSEQSHNFIKFNNNNSIKENLVKLQKLSFDFNNTVGPKSISKQELIKEFNNVL